MALAFLDSLTKSLPFGGLKKDVYLGVDIGSSTIKIVQLKEEKGKIVLDTYGEIALGPFMNMEIGAMTNLDPNTLATALTELMKEANATTTNAVVSVASSASLLFTLDLPASAIKSLASVIPNEARKYIPVPLSEVTLNWMLLPDHISGSDSETSEDDDGKETHDNQNEEKPSNLRQVLIAAIRNDALSQYKNIAAQASLNMVGQEIEVFSAIRSILHRELSPVAIIDIGASGIRIAIVHYGVVRTFHSVSRGGYHITQTIARSLNISEEKAEELKRKVGLGEGQEEVRKTISASVENLISEIQASLLQYEREYHKGVDKIILVGGGARMIGLDEMLKDRLDIYVENGDPFRKVHNPEFLNNILTEVGPEFAIATGLALQKLQ